MTAKLKWAVAVALACGAVAPLLLRTPNDGAQYAGRDLTHWVRDAESSRRKLGKPDPAAQEAILSILTNHCDAVLRRISKPRVFEQKKAHLRASLPNPLAGLRFVRWLLGRSAKAERSYWATVAFAFSGPDVKTVVAQLEQFSSPTNSLSRQAVDALGPIGTPEAEDALVRVLTSPAHPHRLDAMYCLRAFGYSSAQVKRTMTGLLNDADPDVRVEAQSALAYFKSQPGK